MEQQLIAKLEFHPVITVENKDSYALMFIEKWLINGDVIIKNDVLFPDKKNIKKNLGNSKPIKSYKLSFAGLGLSPFQQEIINEYINALQDTSRTEMVSKTKILDKYIVRGEIVWARTVDEAKHYSRILPYKLQNNYVALIPRG